MRDKSRMLSTAILLALVIAGGIFLTDNRQAESQQPQDINFTSPELGNNVFSSSDFTPGLGIEIAQSSCGSDTCSADQCCCLNTDTGAQCCRPNQGGNCVDSCKRGSPC